MTAVAAPPRERPILFSAPMVRAILAGEKTQTRRVAMVRSCGVLVPALQHDPEPDVSRCPHGQPGDQLWVRESWNVFRVVPSDWPGAWELGAPLAKIPDRLPPNCGLAYAADGSEDGPWRPSIHMPRWASRLVLEVTGVRVERLQTITAADAVAEGGPPSGTVVDAVSRGYGYEDFPRSWFAQTWDALNAERGAGWSANPWVWVVEFRRVAGGAA